MKIRRLQVTGTKTSGTAFIEFDDVHVPVSNLIGVEGGGVQYVMTNFNHERLIIAIGATRQARVALSTAFEYSLKREAFGKTLMDQPVVRHRLAKAGAELESMSAWLEQIIHQLCFLPREQADRELGGLTAMAKARAGIVLNECAQCAILLHGGNGLTQTGQGEIIESMLMNVLAYDNLPRLFRTYLTNVIQPMQKLIVTYPESASPGDQRMFFSI